MCMNNLVNEIVMHINHVGVLKSLHRYEDSIVQTQDGSL